MSLSASPSFWRGLRGWALPLATNVLPSHFTGSLTPSSTSPRALAFESLSFSTSTEIPPTAKGAVDLGKLDRDIHWEQQFAGLAENREVIGRVAPDGWRAAAWRAHGLKIAATLLRALPIRSAAARPGLNADALA